MAFQTLSQASISPPTRKKKRGAHLTPQELKRLGEACRRKNEDLRHLLAILLDTDMKLSEAAGLHVSNIHLDRELPYVEVRPDKA